MIADCFLDTNVLFYAAMGRFSEPLKHQRARMVIAGSHFAVSAQVLQEFFVTVTRKSDKPLSMERALDWLDGLRDRPCVPIDEDLVREAAHKSDRFRVSYWDAAILAAAERSGAPVVYTEDLNHGQAYGSVRVENPFLGL